MKYLFNLFLLLPTILYSQCWEKIYENGLGKSVQQTTDGGYIISGDFSSNGSSSDIYLVKANENGDTLWTKTYGAQFGASGNSVQQTTDGGYIITGYYAHGTGDDDVFLIKTGVFGDTLWTKTYGGQYRDGGASVQQTIDDGYIITGWIDDGNNYNVYLIKTNENGDTSWTKTYGGQFDAVGYSVRQTTDGGYIITGSIDDGIHYNDVYLIKTNENGTTTWTKTYAGNYLDEGYSVQETTDGGYVITGFTESVNTSIDVYLIKTNNDGDTLWTKTFGGNFYDGGFSAQQTSDGGYVITGITQSESTHSDLYLIKTDEDGDTLWTRTYGGNYDDVGFSVQQTTDGGYIITGATNDATNNNVYLIKTDNNGIINSTTEIPLPNPNRKLVKMVDLSGREITRPQMNIPYLEIYNDRTSQKKMKIK
jgi:hypothetical protein